jgi:phage-related protein
VIALRHVKNRVWLHGVVKTPPFSEDARIAAGVLLRRLQRGDLVGLPHSRPMSLIGRRCHELRVNDEMMTWRLIYRIDPEDIVISEVFAKKTDRTPGNVVETCKRRYRAYDAI